MRMYAIAQALIITLVVAWSVGFASRRLIPTASRRLQARVATWIESHVRAGRLRRIAHALQPLQAASGGCGTSGCSACGACAPLAQAEARPLVFDPRVKR